MKIVINNCYGGFCLSEKAIKRYLKLKGIKLTEEKETLSKAFIYNFSDKQIKTDISQYISLFVTKNLIWEYQKEWRLIGNAGEKAKAPQIKTVYLGYNVSSGNEKKIHDYFKDTNVNIIKMTKK